MKYAWVYGVERSINDKRVYVNIWLKKGSGGKGGILSLRYQEKKISMDSEINGNKDFKRKNDLHLVTKGH